MIFATVALIGMVATWQSRGEAQRAREARARPLVNELDEFLQTPLQGLRVVPVFSSREDFAYSIDAPDQLARFRESAHRADATPVSGHSGTLFEADLILTNGDRQIRYLATVHEYEPNDLFLGRRWERKDPDGRSFESGRPFRVRVPGLGDWMMAIAPDGRRDRGTHRPCPKQTEFQTTSCARPTDALAPPG